MNTLPQSEQDLFNSFLKIAKPMIKQDTEEEQSYLVNLNFVMYTKNHGIVVIKSPKRGVPELSDKLVFLSIILSVACMFDDTYLAGTFCSALSVDADNPRLKSLVGSDNELELQKYVLNKYGSISESPYGRSLILISADSDNALFMESYHTDPTSTFVDLDNVPYTTAEYSMKSDLKEGQYDAMFAAILEKAKTIKSNFNKAQSLTSEVLYLPEALMMYFRDKFKINFDEDWVTIIEDMQESIECSGEPIKVFQLNDD